MFQALGISITNSRIKCLNVSPNDEVVTYLKELIVDLG
jgi:hypothetical protein